jgi:basic membrane protein A
MAGRHRPATKRTPVATRTPLAWLALAVLVAGVTGCTHASFSDEPSGMRIGVAYDPAGPTDGLVNQSVRDGVYRYATTAHGSVGAIREFPSVTDEPVEDRYDRLVILCESGYNPVIVVGDWYTAPDPRGTPLARAAKACPRTKFAVVNDSGVSASNVANLVFADEQGAFLMGVAAALGSTTHHVGLVGDCPSPSTSALVAGYQGGVDAGHSGTQVSVSYLSDDPDTCPNLTYSRPAAQDAAAALYTTGVDVVYETVGPSGTGVFDAARDHNELAIGMGGDLYQTAGPAVRDAILTSQVDRADIGVMNLLQQFAKGRFHAGVTRYGVGDGGIQYATSGTRVHRMVPILDRYRKGIADGTVTVPGSQ